MPPPTTTCKGSCGSTHGDMYHLPDHLLTTGVLCCAHIGRCRELAGFPATGVTVGEVIVKERPQMEQFRLSRAGISDNPTQRWLARLALLVPWFQASCGIWIIRAPYDRKFRLPCIYFRTAAFSFPLWSGLAHLTVSELASLILVPVLLVPMIQAIRLRQHSTAGSCTAAFAAVLSAPLLSGLASLWTACEGFRTPDMHQHHHTPNDVACGSATHLILAALATGVFFALAAILLQLPRAGYAVHRVTWSWDVFSASTTWSIDDRVRFGFTVWLLSSCFTVNGFPSASPLLIAVVALALASSLFTATLLIDVFPSRSASVVAAAAASATVYIAAMQVRLVIVRYQLSWLLPDRYMLLMLAVAMASAVVKFLVRRHLQRHPGRCKIGAAASRPYHPVGSAESS